MPPQRLAITLLTVVAVVAMVALNVRLVTENRRLVKALTAAEQLNRVAFEVPKGMALSPLAGRSATGEETTITYRGSNRKTLLLVFSSTCPVCESNWPRWQRLAAAAEAESVRIRAVDLPSRAPTGYLARWGGKDEWLIRDIDPRQLMEYRLALTPQTLIIGGDGKVQDVRTGLLSESDLSALTRGLRPDPPVRRAAETE